MLKTLVPAAVVTILAATSLSAAPAVSQLQTATSFDTVQVATAKIVATAAVCNGTIAATITIRQVGAIKARPATIAGTRSGRMTGVHAAASLSVPCGSAHSSVGDRARQPGMAAARIAAGVPE